MESRFLLVDDNTGFLDLTAGLLSRLYPQAHIERTTSGDAALRLLHEQRWDLMLLDYRLPDLDGVEVLAEVRKAGIDVAVIMVTGEGDQELAADLFRMGAYDYLVKGRIGSMTLRRSIDQVLTRRGLEQQIREKSDQLGTTTRELAERARALDTAYDKLQEKKEQLKALSDALEMTVQQRTAELRATTSFLNRVLDAAADHFILATDGDGRVLTFNTGAEAAFGRPAREVVGKEELRAFFVETQPEDGQYEPMVEEARATGAAKRVLTGIRGDGTKFVAKVSASPLQGSLLESRSEGQSGIVVVGADVTHERELEAQNRDYTRQIELQMDDLVRKNEQILEATRLKSEFLANVSHELRTPLNAIIGYGDLLLGGIYGELGGRQESAVDGIATRARDLLRLINEILDLAKIESGKMELVIETFPLGPVLDELRETAQVLSRGRGLAVEWRDLGAAGIEMSTDRGRLRQVLGNLVSNAVKFTHEGFVRIESEAAGDDAVEVRVRDSGIGIPESALESIFDEFRQVDGTSTRKYEGTGLGLAISRKFATNMGGTLIAESEFGRGSTFRLRLPRRAPTQS
jgi:PAS domain S-box-containing protein